MPTISYIVGGYPTTTFLVNTINNDYIVGSVYFAVIPLPPNNFGASVVSTASPFVPPPSNPGLLLGENMYLSISAANTQAIAFSPNLDGGFVDIYGDSYYVGNPETPTISPPLCTFSIGTPFAAYIANGTITANPILPAVTLVTGYATWFRVTKSDHTTVLFDGTVSTAGGNLNFNSLLFTAGVTQMISAFTYTMPGV